jgi:hypothetical protein
MDRYLPSVSVAPTMSQLDKRYLLIAFARRAGATKS